MEAFFGVWDLGAIPMDIRPGAEGPEVWIPGTPEGFASVLQPTGDPDRMVLRGGTFDGTVFSLEDGHLAVGPMTAAPLGGPYEEPPGYGLLAPDFAPQAERDEGFASLAQQMGDGSELEWSVPYPKHEFVQWLGTLDRYIFHGSNDREIEEFLPVRTSLEFYDHGERGNLGAVYGTHDGLWSMFFAVVDRSRIRGSIRNGVTTFEATDGRRIDTYQFSVEQSALADRPFTTGALYVLPRSSFRRLPMWQGGPMSNEWASVDVVRPLARIVVAPEDFPFLDEVAGHDDGPILRTLELTRELVDAATAATEIEGGYAIELSWNDRLATVYEEWRPAWSDLMPNVVVDLEGSGERRTWTLRGPDAFRSTAREWVGDLLDD